MFHWVRLRAFVYATEDRNKVIEAMKNVGISGDVKSKYAEGAYGDTIEIIEIKSVRRKDIDTMFSSLKSEGLKNLLNTVEERTDDEGIFHFRLDKQKIYNHSFTLSSGGDVISVEVKIRAYPSSREKAVEIMRDYLEGLV